MNYSSRINPPDLTLCNAWTKSDNTILITAVYTGHVGIGLNDPSSILEIGELELSINKINFGHCGRWAVNQIFCDYFYRFLTSHTAVMN